MDATKHTQRQETLKTMWAKGDLSIVRWQIGHAYARNGNAHNPTPKYVYQLMRRGQGIDCSMRFGILKKEALELLAGR